MGIMKMMLMISSNRLERRSGYERTGYENCDRYNVLISGVFFGAFPKKIVSAVCQKIPACATIKNILIPHAFYNFSTEKILKPNQRNTLLLQAFR